jgi:hypothetical protein
MDEFENTSVEMEEVAELPEEETGEEEQESAEPASEEQGRSEQDAAWARMRREKEQAQSELEAAKAEINRLMTQNNARVSAYERLTGSEDGEIAALAEATGLSEDEVRAEMEAAEESAQKDLRIAQLEQQVTSIQADRMMQEDLNKLRKIDPSLASLDDLGENYPSYISAGLSPEQAYWAIKAEESANKATPPKAVGKVATGTAEKDYFTDAEIDSMSSEQLEKNWKKIIASWDRKAKR